MEKEFIVKLKEHIESSSLGWAEVQMNVFIKMWGVNPRDYDKRMTKNLLRFDKEHNLGHVSVIRGNRVIAIRFWKVKETELLEEPNEVQD